MPGLNLTYQTLANTRNEAAIDALVAVLGDADAATRRQALSALVARPEDRCPQLVLACWSQLQHDDLRVLRPKKNWMKQAIQTGLRGGGENVLQAISAAKALGLTGVISDLVLIAESSGSRPVRKAATDAVLEMAQPLGRDARADRDQPTIRGPVISRLADSVRRFSMHRNEQLVDAFLLASSWGDGDLRQLLAENSPERELICRRLAESELISVIDLLAGFLRRRNIPAWISAIIGARKDILFRESLLRAVGVEPTTTVIRNLKDLGLPQCCRGGESLLDELTPEYRAPLAHLYVAADTDPLRILHLAAAVVERGGPGCEAAAANGFSRTEVPDIDFWMRAAVPVADGNDEAINNNENARLLRRLINLLDHSDPSLLRGVRRVLGPLHADQMLTRFGSLRPRSRRRLGRVVMLVDPDAIERIRDALRHPVLKNRLAAIAAADALAAVDLLADSFTHIAREDHHEARMSAAKAMSEANGETTLALLKEMVNLPESTVRDAAVAALQQRQSVAT